VSAGDVGDERAVGGAHGDGRPHPGGVRRAHQAHLVLDVGHDGVGRPREELGRAEAAAIGLEGPGLAGPATLDRHQLPRRRPEPEGLGDGGRDLRPRLLRVGPATGDVLLEVGPAPEAIAQGDVGLDVAQRHAGLGEAALGEQVLRLLAEVVEARVLGQGLHRNSSLSRPDSQTGATVSSDSSLGPGCRGEASSLPASLGAAPPALLGR
jgi:hypothetical protein